MKHFNISLFVSMFLLMVGLTGCGSGTPTMGKVSGNVTYDGQPIKTGSIIFEVDGTRPAYGKIVNGEIIEVTTLEPNDGAFLGSSKIAVFATEANSPTAEDTSPTTPGEVPNPGASSTMKSIQSMSPKSIIPERYNNPQTSELTFEIKAGENVVNLELSKE